MSDHASAASAPTPVSAAARPPVEARLGKVGVWSGQFDFSPAGTVREAVAELDDLGYSTLWTGEVKGREVLVTAGLMLAATRRMTIATGIAQILARNPLTMTAGQLALAEAHPGRFLLGLGVSHAELMSIRGATYSRPLGQMRAYLDEMDRMAAEQYRAVPPEGTQPRVLAALGPKMLELARDRADGAHTYFVPPEHTAAARAVLGPGKLLVPEQAFVLHPDATEARELARRHTGSYLRLPNYTNNLRRYGFTDGDFTDGGSDRLVDTIVPWGDVDVLLGRVKEHLDAGADQVAVQVLDFDRRGLPRRQWRELAPALLSL
ncbi:LLM class F420-dependent oxidoreductase [Frankia sp. CcI49]|uniref:LLM class F420-dependent oxidoreductase n=1 Tax=Frankia sp. CcI49 TaxID=1745382 RepID=UPI00097615D8|nr:LLM class F420-dependent oxidoreductase [Frankia sp. CcI49]ONH57761.1 LLM class F420-dependent oxidoreductase [Frankia sp. CcI49]